MMPLDRMPSASLGIIVPAGAVYDSRHHWRTDTGALRASVHFEVGGYSYATIKASRPRCGSWPPPSSRRPTEPEAPRTLPIPWPWWRGWPADVGR